MSIRSSDFPLNIDAFSPSEEAIPLSGRANSAPSAEADEVIKLAQVPLANGLDRAVADAIPWPDPPHTYPVRQLLLDDRTGRFVHFDNDQPLPMNRLLGISLVAIPCTQRYKWNPLPSKKGKFACVSLDGVKCDTAPRWCDRCHFRLPDEDGRPRCHESVLQMFHFLDVSAPVVWRFDFHRNEKLGTLSEYEMFHERIGHKKGVFQAGYPILLSVVRAPRRESDPARFMPRLTLLSTQRRETKRYRALAKEVRADAWRELNRELKRNRRDLPTWRG